MGSRILKSDSYSQTNLVRLSTSRYEDTANFLPNIANHLDLGAVVWLEAYLSTYNHILVVRTLLHTTFIPLGCLYMSSDYFPLARFHGHRLY